MSAPCILQFGTSRFLQAHVDLFASEARETGQDVPDIVIVQTTNDPERARRLAGFSDPMGYSVILRGIEQGAAIERQVRVTSVRSGVSAAAQWSELVDLFVERATYIVSNTGDSGYAITEADRQAAPGERPSGFCAMLVELLYRRWSDRRAGMTLLPCELVQRNGDTLRALVLRLAADQGRDASFRTWLRTDCIWANTLVDRIVSTPLEPAGAVAEPYALWAVERQAGLQLPFTHPAVTLTDDLEPFERLKLHILNLGHSWLAARWHASGSDPKATVRAAMADPETRAALARLLSEEVIPGFAAHGLGDVARAYVATTLERFDNPFLDHRLADIFSGHSAKLDKRVGGFLRWVDAVEPAPDMPELRALASNGPAV